MIHRHDAVPMDSEGRPHVDQYFPMYLVSRKTVTEMTGLLVHEELRKQGLLICMREEGHVLFISHTWLSNTHPDPNFLQLRVLQKLLANFASGRRDLPMFWFDTIRGRGKCMKAKVCGEIFSNALLWLDYCSIPQDTASPGVAEQQLAAIRRIPSYVARANNFIALVPPCMHRERQLLIGHREWRGRAWCRFEMITYCFSHPNADVIIAESDSQVYMASSHTWLFSPVGRGDLTCCRLNHEIKKDDGSVRSIPCDKVALKQVLTHLYDSKIAGYEAAGDLESYRVYSAVRSQVFAGFPSDAADDKSKESAQEFLRRYRFKSAFDEERPRGSGFTPLRFAAIECNLGVMKELLGMRADIECPLQAPRSDVAYFKAATILHGSASTHSNPEVLQLLLDHGASVDARALPHQMTPLHNCGKAEAVEVFERSGVSVTTPDSVLKMDILTVCFFRFAYNTGTEDFILHVIKLGVPPTHWFLGHSHLHLAVFVRSRLITEELLRRPEFVNAAIAAQSENKCSRLGAIVLRAMALKSRFSTDPNVALASELLKCSPLHLSAAQNDVDICKLLLEHGFPMTDVNHRGRTPLHLAAFFGHMQVVKLFLKHPDWKATLRLRCHHGATTARQLAERSGFESISALLQQEEELLGAAEDPDGWAVAAASMACSRCRCGARRRAAALGTRPAAADKAEEALLHHGHTL